ncbi:kinase-like protein [Teratosphaeria nubilosa]|uniref:Kinase-like protein n=1 Tax=Teratosphaeria nubilosa TaxID=161662 RepID=A0A6G1L043_9PEZI|nr:kinase-like protein [Teratosphaeria nubilosa]
MVQDITPLPSPLVGSASPGPWKKASVGLGASRSRQSSLESASLQRQVSLPDSPVKRKRYGSLVQEATIANAAGAQGKTQAGASNSDSSLKGHGRNRSISDFVPEQLHNVHHRHVTFGPGDAQNLAAQEYHLHRETNFAAQRGLAAQSSRSRDRGAPTPPLNTSSVAESEDQQHEQMETPRLEDGTATEYLEIHCGIHNKRRKFRQLRQLGQGTFSKVMLATSEKIPARITPEIEATLEPHKLVAVKIVQYGPAGGADEERIEISLKREVDMLREVKHPCISHLKACEYQETRALLVIPYSPGGDLFEFATEYHAALTPALMQRMFAELVDAVKYLHANYIVHRDIKLENVLVNLPKDKLQQIPDPRTYPSPIITLTDLGLSRRIAKPPESPLLETRCGSEDYAAPELILGQGYDGRQTDAWALGVLLYALMEGRLPFDPLPGRPARVRNVHRIARVEWIWIQYGDAYGDWDEFKVPQDLKGAREVVEGLLKKVSKGRLDLDQLAELPWVKEGLQIELKAQEEDDDMLV